MVRVEREGEDDLRIAVDEAFCPSRESVTVLARVLKSIREIDEAAAQRDAESDDPATAARSSEASRPGPDRLEGPPMSASMMAMVALVGVLLFHVVALCYRAVEATPSGRDSGDPARCAAVGGHGCATV